MERCQRLQAGSAQVLKAVVGGSADVVPGAFEHTINMQIKNPRMRASALHGRAPASIGPRIGQASIDVGAVVTNGFVKRAYDLCYYWLSHARHRVAGAA